MQVANLWPSVADAPNFTPHQREMVGRALSKPMGILCGSPGVGKTFCLAEVAKRVIKSYGADNIAVMCPTGKAAVRISESMLNCGVQLRAKTIHSHLSYLDEHFSLPFKFVLFDEASMIDTDLAATIISGCPKGTHILWTGDPHQLPPVGHGAPLRDMIASGIAYGDLRQIMRSTGGIVETCAAIRDENEWDAGDNLLIDRASNPDSQIKCILERLQEAKHDGLDPVWDVQTVVAVNERSPLSRKELNKTLQSFLNHEAGQDGVPFRLGDKIVNGKNGWFDLSGSSDDEAILNDRGQCYVANGELAKVLAIDRAGFVAKLTSPDRVINVRMFKDKSDDDAEGQSTGSTFELGYALTVHKAQGSDWPRVLVVLDEYPGAKMICDRSFLYTAISRGKEQVVLIGKKEIADRMCKVSNIWRRKTFLKESIQHEQCLELLANV